VTKIDNFDIIRNLCSGVATGCARRAVQGTHRCGGSRRTLYWEERAIWESLHTCPLRP